MVGPRLDERYTTAAYYPVSACGFATYKAFNTRADVVRCVAHLRDMEVSKGLVIFQPPTIIQLRNAGAIPISALTTEGVNPPCITVCSEMGPYGNNFHVMRGVPVEERLVKLQPPTWDYEGVKLTFTVSAAEATLQQFHEERYWEKINQARAEERRRIKERSMAKRLAKQRRSVAQASVQSISGSGASVRKTAGAALSDTYSSIQGRSPTLSRDAQDAQRSKRERTRAKAGEASSQQFYDLVEGSGRYQNHEVSWLGLTDSLDGERIVHSAESGPASAWPRKPASSSNLLVRGGQAISPAKAATPPGRFPTGLGGGSSVTPGKDGKRTASGILRARRNDQVHQRIIQCSTSTPGYSTPSPSTPLGGVHRGSGKLNYGFTIPAVNPTTECSEASLWDTTSSAMAFPTSRSSAVTSITERGVFGKEGRSESTPRVVPPVAMYTIGDGSDTDSDAEISCERGPLVASGPAAGHDETAGVRQRLEKISSGHQARSSSTSSPGAPLPYPPDAKTARQAVAVSRTASGRQENGAGDGPWGPRSPDFLREIRMDGERSQSSRPQSRGGGRRSSGPGDAYTLVLAPEPLWKEVSGAKDPPVPRVAADSACGTAVAGESAAVGPSGGGSRCGSTSAALSRAAGSSMPSPPLTQPVPQSLRGGRAHDNKITNLFASEFQPAIGAGGRGDACGAALTHFVSLDRGGSNSGPVDRLAGTEGSGSGSTAIPSDVVSSGFGRRVDALPALGSLDPNTMNSIRSKNVHYTSLQNASGGGKRDIGGRGVVPPSAEAGGPAATRGEAPSCERTPLPSVQRETQYASGSAPVQHSDEHQDVGGPRATAPADELRGVKGMPTYSSRGNQATKPLASGDGGVGKDVALRRVGNEPAPRNQSHGRAASASGDEAPRESSRGQQPSRGVSTPYGDPFESSAACQSTVAADEADAAAVPPEAWASTGTKRRELRTEDEEAGGVREPDGSVRGVRKATNKCCSMM